MVVSNTANLGLFTNTVLVFPRAHRVLSFQKSHITSISRQFNLTVFRALSGNQNNIESPPCQAACYKYIMNLLLKAFSINAYPLALGNFSPKPLPLFLWSLCDNLKFRERGKLILYFSKDPKREEKGKFVLGRS